MTETLFDLAFDAYNRDCLEISSEIQKMLLSWAFKAGRHQTGWGIMQRSMYALATLAVLRGGGALSERLKQAISERLAGETPPSQEQLDRVAREIRRQAATLHRLDYTLSRIESAMGRADQEQVALLLREIANILSPGTTDEPVDIF